MNKSLQVIEGLSSIIPEAMEGEVNIDVEGKRVYVRSPFNREFVRQAKKLRGKWDSERRAWRFGKQKEDDVRTLVSDVFGVESGVVETEATDKQLEFVQRLFPLIKANNGESALRKELNDREEKSS